jgi:hypothetical protein
MVGLVTTVEDRIGSTIYMEFEHLVRLSTYEMHLAVLCGRMVDASGENAFGAAIDCSILHVKHC